MRTTLNVDHDVLDRARRLARKSRRPLRLLVNEALRLGLGRIQKGSEKRRYRTKPHTMGLRRGMSLDNIQELLATVEGEDSR